MHPTYTVLLVEDDPTLGPLTADVLQFYGHTVYLVASVEEAIATLCAANDFDAVFLDLELGAERGESIVQEARRVSCALPEIIILSAQPMDQLHRVKSEIDACEVLQKPVSPRQLDAAIQRCAEKRRGD
jgi:DNA-binding response OmpR family regulator